MTKKYFVNNRPRTRLALLLFLVLSAGAGATVYTRSVYGHNQDIAKLNRFVQSTRANSASAQTFREGRDLIEAQNWQKAAEKFNDFIRVYPKDKDLDAALYWYAYALEKQGRKDDAAAPLKTLINRFPGSNWRRDASALLVAMGHQAAVDDAIKRDNCEIKILALQSLFQADEERAIGIVTEALKSNPPCVGFQAAAVSMLGSHRNPRVIPLLLEIARSNPDQKLRLTAIKRLGDQRSEQVTDELIKLYDADRTKEVRAQILRALVDSRTPRGTAKVMEIARSSDDLAARQYAIRHIGEMKDPAALDELIRIFDADKTMEIRSQILRALAGREEPRAREKILNVARTGETPELRIQAIRALGGRGRVAIDDLLQLYTSETNLQIKQGLLRTFADNSDPRAQAKLFEIARGNDPVELRGYAIRHLGNKDDQQTVDQLVAMYDGEQNQQVKMTLLRAFGDSKQKSAVRKLVQIARNDQSVDMRKLAVRYLGDSKDPEALKFLEELLK
ncbi:MAG TPA: HEAT repeat domain-containing protein [Pyrinomonadaceae bacterium]|nr:HEAT repeat domain-containing protein [Pyrinomonadaceae bacterium]